MAAAAFRQQVKVFVAEHLTPAARAAHLARYARQHRDSLIAAGRASPSYRTFVDGREGAREESVRPEGGVILYQFSAIGEAVTLALDELRRRSPVRTGRFLDSWMVSVNGRPMPAADFVARSCPLDAEVVIYDLQPYARKVDVQLIGARRLHYSVPADALADTAKALRRRYGNSISARRVYTMSVPGQYRLRRDQARRSAGSPVETPALILKPLR